MGDITVTVVPGVDSEDLLGFSAETLTLLGDEATRAHEILQQKYGLSHDQMVANARLRRALKEWVPLNEKLSDGKKRELVELIGGAIHPLVLRLRGPGVDFRYITPPLWLT